MTERPILFSAPMVRALIEGRKTQTRRVLKFGSEPAVWAGEGFPTSDPAKWAVRYYDKSCDCTELRFLPDVPLIKAGDRLYVREAWQTGSGPNGPQISFRATPDFFDIDAWDGPDEGIGPSFNYDRCPCAHFHHWLPDVLSNDGPWRTPLHMPRWASRLTLPVTEVRVQRLQEIDEADARAEGIAYQVQEDTRVVFPVPGHDDYANTAKGAYRKLWNHLNEKRGFGWDANPWVVAVSFSVERRNIDEPAR